MFRSPMWTEGGGSLSDARAVEFCSGRARLEEEFFHGIAEMVDDMRLNSLPVLLGRSFLLFLSEVLSSSPSWLWWLWIDLDSLIRRPNDLQLLSDDERGNAVLGSREWEEEEGARGDAGSVLGVCTLSRTGL
jgi:hypothetical protein